MFENIVWHYDLYTSNEKKKRGKYHDRYAFFFLVCVSARVRASLVLTIIVIKSGLNVDSVYELGHWFNQWVIGRTVGSNNFFFKIKYI